MTDPIADLITRIKNAYLARQEAVSIPHSKLKQELAKLLEQAGYIKTLTITEAISGRKILKAQLKYHGKYPTLNGFERLSKPGRRLYASAKDLKPVLSGQGLTILSTSRGLMIDRDAKKTNTGGELLCKIW